jgi:protein-histidine pros-kinase
MKSLAGRVFLILFAATVVVQVLSFGGVVAFHGIESRRQMYEFMAADLDFVCRFLRSQPPEVREAALKDLNRGYYELSLRPASLAYRPVESDRVREKVEPVQEKLGPDTPVRAVMVPNGTDTRLGLEMPIDATQKLVVVFEGKEPPFSPPSIWVILAYLATVMVAVMPFAWFAVCIPIRPMRRFAEAARALGRNLNAPQVAETGPVEVVEAARAFNAMQRAIQKHVDERTQILASVSHDLKTPLTRLRLRVGDVAPEPLRQRLEADLDAMGTLVQEGLDYAQSAQVREQRVPLDLNRLVEDVAERAADMGQQVQTSGRLDAPCTCSPRAVERALQNLVDNAVKYGGCVHIRLSNGGGQVEIRVDDEGPGLPPELLDKAFDPFFRAEQSRSRETGGTGLGLSIARNLMRAHGGDITLENRAAGGLSARIVLPLNPAAA